MQKMEAADMIRAAAHSAGYGDRRLFFADANFDWGALSAHADNLSLFSEKKFIEIVAFSEKLNKEGKEFLRTFAERPAEDTILVLRVNKIDAREAWVKRVEAVGVVVQVYIKEGGDMTAWLRERMLKAGLKVENQVVELIAERVAGNMLAAAQEVEKLKLLHSDSVVSLEDAERAISDSSKYNVYDLAEAASGGDAKRAVRILRGLRDEGCAPNLVLWSLTAQIRKLADLDARLAKGESLDAVLRKEWRSKHTALRKALTRKPRIPWERLLYWCGETDKAAKGVSGADVWQQLLRLALRMSGARVLSEKVT